MSQATWECTPPPPPPCAFAPPPPPTVHPWAPCLLALLAQDLPLFNFFACCAPSKPTYLRRSLLNVKRCARVQG